MMDGTEDKNGVELEAVVLRFWDGENIAEHVLAMEPAYDRSADGLLKILTKTLDKHDIKLDGAASDCFDGASVNSGWKSKFKLLLVTTVTFLLFKRRITNTE